MVNPVFLETPCPTRGGVVFGTFFLGWLAMFFTEDNCETPSERRCLDQNEPDHADRDTAEEREREIKRRQRHLVPDVAEIFADTGEPGTLGLGLVGFLVRR